MDEHPAHRDKRVADRRASRYESASIEPDSPGARPRGTPTGAWSSRPRVSPGASAASRGVRCSPSLPEPFMAETTPVAEPATLPSIEEIERASAFAREPFLTEGEDAASALAPGTPRRRALDAALVELEAGREGPVAALAPPVVAAARPGPPALAGRAAPGRRHRAVRAPGRRAVGHADRAARRPPQERRRGRARRRAGAGRLASAGIPGEEDLDDEDEPEEPQDWDDPARPRTTRTSPRRPRTRTPASASGSSTRPARARPSPPSASSRRRAPAAS